MGGVKGDKPLPPGAVMIEYLGSTGTQYIDSGIECTGDLSVEYTGMVSTNVNVAALGAIKDFGSSIFRHHWSPTTSGNVFYWIQNNKGDASIESLYSVNTWYTVSIDADDGVATINGNTVRFTPVSGSVSAGANYGIFARLGLFQCRPSSFQYVKLRRGGTLLRDFIPVRIGTTGYMFDKVSGQLFGNAGTGDFILGSDKYDTEIEYLESSGSQYIDTGVYPDSTYTFDTDVTLLSSSNTVFWGCRSSGTYSSLNSQCYLNTNPPTFPYIYLYSTSTNTSVNWRTDFRPELGTMYSLIGMTVVSTMSTMTYPITLFAFNNIGNLTKMSCRIGSFTAYSNGVKVCDMIPVRVGQVGYMYDKVSGRLIGNAGTGDFILGADKI